MKLISPKTEAEFKQYYHLRWRILRQPWGQPEGSEHDAIDDKGEEFCHHIAAVKNHRHYALRIFHKRMRTTSLYGRR